MKRLIQTALFSGLLLVSASAFAGQVSFGIRIGAPPAPRGVRVVPRSPGADYVRVEGYWYPVGNHYKWHDGYWTRPPYQGARWVGPHHDGSQFYAGYWEGDKGRMEHNHGSDRGKGRDYRRP